LIILFHKHSVIIDIFTIIKKAFNLNLNPVEPNKLDFNHKKLMVKKNKILYVSRHDGTIANFDFIAKHLGFNTTILRPDFKYGGYPECYYNDKCISFVKEKCSEFDYIVICDTIPDGFVFLINECNKKIILEITNRFDYGIKYKNYYKIFAQAIKNKNIIIVENNPFEVYHACEKNVFIKNYYLIRPIGNPPNSTVRKEHKQYHDIVAIIDKYPTSKLLMQKLNEVKLPYKILPHKHGGPLVLSTYKAIIMLPYQVSVMKIMENLRYGVPMIIPSEKLLRELIKGKYFFPAKHLFKITDGVKNYIEFYNDLYRDYFIYFDSFNDLHNIIKYTDFKTFRENEKKFAIHYEQKALKMWEEILDISIVKESKIIDKEPLCYNKVFF
jgi:hypothetical protein